MDLRRARTFVTVAELGTVSKAALHLRVAQPALSRQISDLEHELSLQLFDRIGRRLVLTSEGEQLLGDCRTLLNYAGAVDEKARLLQRGDSGVLKVAASPQHIESVFAQLVPRFSKSYPNVRVNVREGSGREILGMLERGEIHFAQSLLHAVKPHAQRFAIQPLEPVDLLAASHPRVVLGNRGVIEVERLADHPLLLLDGGFGFRQAFDAACRLAGLEPKIQFESRAPHTLLALAEAGHGVAIIPSALRTDRYKLRIIGVTYRGKPLREPLSIAWDKRRPLPRYAVAFCELWTSHVREVFPITRPRPAFGRTRK